MKKAINRYIDENLEDLLKLDMKLARVFGAPAPHTISSYAHVKWKWLEPIINFFFRWIKDELNHCKNDYERVTNGLKRAAGKDQPKKSKGKA